MTENITHHQDYTALRFLIADDKAFIRTIVQGMLLRLKAKDVIQAANGEQGLKLLRKYGKRVSCVISDWNMHPVGGLELLRAVRTGEIRGVPPETCFIMLTGHSAEKVVKAAIALDVHAYLVKPVSFEKLVKTVDAAMEKQLTLKTPEQYRAVSGLEIPASVKAAEAHQPPWVLWIAKSPRREQLEERIKQIRADIAAGAHAAPESDEIEMTNVRRLTLNEIKPGLLLAEDIYGSDRALLVAAGTALSSSLLVRLRELSEGAEHEEAKLWVGDRVAAAS